MNILVIGNGFDLAHELPTRYTDFLEFIKLFTDCYEKVKNGTMDWLYFDINNQVNFFLKKWFSAYYENENGQRKEEKKATVKIIDEFYDNIEDNFWIDYFLQCNMHGKENWIDFESEISDLIKSLDKDMHGSDNKHSLYDGIDIHFSNDFIDSYSKFEECITFKEVRDILVKDLNALIRALEIYLTDFIGRLECKSISPDIKEAIGNSDKCMINNTEVHICQVICFNYTDTYEKLYLESKSTKNLIDYIHGKACINRAIEDNNMVLGIDEFLPDDRKNKDVEFIAFKKYYQRIYKQTGCKYKKLVNEIRKNWDKESEDNKAEIRKCISEGYLNDRKIYKLYIFGHSLDVTDEDILRDLILNDNVKTTIFYHNKDAMGQQIANLVKVIGQDELIKRTGGSTKTIEFKQQQDMEPIKD